MTGIQCRVVPDPSGQKVYINCGKTDQGGVMTDGEGAANTGHLIGFVHPLDAVDTEAIPLGVLLKCSG